VAKYINDFTVLKSIRLTPKYQLMHLQAPAGYSLDCITPGQFVQIKADSNSTTFLRRPISVHDVNTTQNILSILICRAGNGTNTICDTPIGNKLNIMWPLGNGFTIPSHKSMSPLLVGGGVGVAPLLYLGKKLKDSGFTPKFLLAARTAADLLQLDQFSKYGTVYTSTDDGSAGQKGLISQNTILKYNHDIIYCCGPMPMMKAIARLCKSRSIECQVSLENVMACGIGACLCCVEKTIKGNRCVCTEGPVFNINQLTW